MKQTHTPGPWGYDRVTGDIFREDGDLFETIATIDIDDVAAEEYDPNLYLIAAAPELLAALVNITDLADEAVTEREHSDDPEDREMAAQFRRDVSAAYAAITKAKGGAA
jgi:hypothetical protein